MTENNDVRELREQEQAHTPSAKYRLSRKEKARLLAGFRRALEECDQAVFEEAIRELGQLPGTPEYERSLKAWKSFHGRRGR
jgi:hypothetical protein